LPAEFGTTLLLVAAIAAGALLGSQSPSAGEALSAHVDATLLAMISLLFFEVRLESVLRAFGNLRFIALAWAANFLLVPVIGLLIASLFLSGQKLFLVGLFIYFMAPCTDWFLGFTRLAGGNTVLGSALIPINMVTQLALYPVYLMLVVPAQIGLDLGFAADSLLQWFLTPFLAATVLHHLLRRILPAGWFEALLVLTGRLIPFVIALLVFEIFAANVATILAHAPVFAWILLAVFVFFVATYWLGEALARLFRLAYPEHALLTMTIAARNAPLMLGVTIAALPDQPLTHAAIIIGMLVEFPHLTVLRQILTRGKARPIAPPPVAALPRTSR